MLSRTRDFPDTPHEKPCLVKASVDHARYLLRQVPGFLKSCFVDGTRAIIAGRYNRRQAAIVIAAMAPILIGTAVITVPLILFPTEAHKAYFQFANILNTDPVSMIPLAIGSVAAMLGLKVPVG